MYVLIKAVKFMLDPEVTSTLFSRITDNTTHDSEYYKYPSDYSGNTAHDHGTTHLSILAENGDAVSCTNSINYQ